MWMVYYRYRFVVALGISPLIFPGLSPYLIILKWFDFGFSESLGYELVNFYICSHLT